MYVFSCVFGVGLVMYIIYINYIYIFIYIHIYHVVLMHSMNDMFVSSSSCRKTWVDSLSPNLSCLFCHDEILELEGPRDEFQISETDTPKTNIKVKVPKKTKAFKGKCWCHNDIILCFSPWLPQTDPSLLWIFTETRAPCIAFETECHGMKWKFLRNCWWSQWL